MEFDKINFRKFNPQKLYQASEEDDAYLEEYGSTRKPQRSEKRILSSLETSDKNSQILLFLLTSSKVFYVLSRDERVEVAD